VREVLRPRATLSPLRKSTNMSRVGRLVVQLEPFFMRGDFWFPFLYSKIVYIALNMGVFLSLGVVSMLRRDAHGSDADA